MRGRLGFESRVSCDALDACRARRRAEARGERLDEMGMGTRARSALCPLHESGRHCVQEGARVS